MNFSLFRSSVFAFVVSFEEENETFVKHGKARTILTNKSMNCLLAYSWVNQCEYNISFSDFGEFGNEFLTQNCFVCLKILVLFLNSHGYRMRMLPFKNMINWIWLFSSFEITVWILVFFSSSSIWLVLFLHLLYRIIFIPSQRIDLLA